jgi:nucleotide-binding universal stress UspA family protein
MYQKILAPLDGSQLAECSLDHVKAIAFGCNVPKIVLLRVLDPIKPVDYGGLYGQGYKDFSPDFLTQSWTRRQAEAEAYFSELNDRLKKESLPVETVLISGDDAAGTILDYARDNGIDLIIISTHGRSGPTRWLIGSVADKVVRHSPVPVLIVSPSSCRGVSNSS